MKNQFLYISLLFVLLTSCELTEVENPNVSNDKYLSSPKAAASWVNGTGRELAQTLNTIIEFSELTSDNYYNNRTLSSKVFDIPQIDDFDIDVNRVQSAIHSLRQAATFGLEEVLPADAESDAEDEAILRFYRGNAYLFAGSYTVGLPVAELGAVVEPAGQFELAAADFTEVIKLTSDTDLELAATLALARAHYRLGNRTEAMTAAQSVIDADPMFNYQVLFDGINGPANGFQFYLFDSSNDEFAPLPRLDFLDPKFYHIENASQEQQPVSLFKAEEAYLIIAEGQLAASELSDARTTLTNLLNTVIANRPLVSFDDSRENRNGGNRTDYPLTADVKVAFEPGATPREGFILDRQAGNITIPVVSGSSVTVAQLQDADTEDALLELLYLMRQEIFIAEGHRMVDLGIRYPVSETEKQYNGNVGQNSSYSSAQIPSFIPGDFGMDDFTFDTENGIITIQYNMNKLLVENKTAAEVLPFH